MGITLKAIVLEQDPPYDTKKVLFLCAPPLPQSLSPMNLYRFKFQVEKILSMRFNPIPTPPPLPAPLNNVSFSSTLFTTTFLTEVTICPYLYELK